MRDNLRRIGIQRSLTPPMPVLVVAYAGGIAAWNVLGHTGLAQWWPFQLVSVFHVWLYLPLPLLLLWASLRRDGRRVALLLLPLLFFIGDYGLLFLPRTAEEQGNRFVVMTANLAYGNGDALHVDRLLREERPDVVALQELGVGISTQLGDRVRDLYPYQVLRPQENTLGMGILSRYPVLDSSRAEMASDCRCQEVTLDLDGHGVTILNVHPDPPITKRIQWERIVLPASVSTEFQNQMLLGVLARARAATGPVLILGDLNMTDHESVYSTIGSRYHDAYREAGWGLGFTFPTARRTHVPFSPVIRIDYVFHDDAWIANAARVVDVPGSDHRGVLAEVTLRSGQAEPATGSRPFPRD